MLNKHLMLTAIINYIIMLLSNFAYVDHSWRLFSCQCLYHLTGHINGSVFISLTHDILGVATASH